MSGTVVELLGELQSISDSIDKMELMRSEALGVKERIEEKLEASRAELEEKQQLNHELDMERRKKEVQLKAEKERHQRIKGRVGEVKTGREYQAVIAETNTSKAAITGHEEGLLKDMEKLEALGEELQKAQEKVDMISSDAKEAQEKLAAIEAETEGGINEGRAKEKKILGELPPEVVAKYKLIRSRIGGVAVAEAHDEACTACFMRLPPQRYIEVMRGKKVEQCPNCYRILIPKRTV